MIARVLHVDVAMALLAANFLRIARARSRLMHRAYRVREEDARGHAAVHAGPGGGSMERSLRLPGMLLNEHADDNNATMDTARSRRSGGATERRRLGAHQEPSSAEWAAPVPPPCAPDGAAAEDLRARLDRLRAGRLFDGVDAAAAPAEKAAELDDEPVRLVTGNDRAEQAEADRWSPQRS